MGAGVGRRSVMLRVTSLMVAAVVVSALAVAPAAVPATAQEEVGDVGISFVADAAAQFRGLSRRPDGLGFDIADSPDPRACKHYQGVVRVQGPDGTPYLFITRSGNQPQFLACPGEDHDPGNLLVVRMDSRDRAPERLRSNRFARDWPLINPDPSDATFWPTPPDRRDRVVRTITLDGTGDWPPYRHPGGMQLIGDVLVVALETPALASLPESLILFVDVSDPENPTPLSSYQPSGDPDFKAGVLGVTPIRAPDGSCCRYLMLVTGGINTDVRFYLSDPAPGSASSDLRSKALTWTEVGRFHEGQLDDCIGADWHTGIGDAHQMLNFVREASPDGSLYVVGARNDTKFVAAADYVDLYRVRLTGEGHPMADCPLRHVDTRNLTSYPYMGGGDSANFAAAAGIYVSPSGELILYATEYENDGPFRQEADGSQGNVRTVRFGEWRHVDVVRRDSPTLRPTAVPDGPFAVDEGAQVALSALAQHARTQAWIQLYEDDGAGNSVPGGGNMWLAVDYVDRAADDFDDFRKLAFDNNAGSWRWFAPAGCSITVTDYPSSVDGYPGPDTVVLEGDGKVHIERDLDSIRFDDDAGGVRFGTVDPETAALDRDCDRYYRAPLSLEWDLDGDGTVDERGAPVTFDAGLLDGPSSRSVRTRATHPTDTTTLGRSDWVASLVAVRNVPPAIVSAVARDDAGGQLGADVPGALTGVPVGVEITFTDPGYHDGQTAVIDWGDGTTQAGGFDLFSDARFGALGVLRHSHVYETAGSYDATVTITDDDGGATAVTVEITVLSPKEAVGAVADILTSALETSDAAVAPLLEKARDHLVGNDSGAAANGALDKLESGEPEAALEHIDTAIGYLLEAHAAGAPDLLPLVATLCFVSNSVARAAYLEAESAVSPPSKGERRQLERIQQDLAAGAEATRAGHYQVAMDHFQVALSRALDLMSQ